MSQKRSLKNRFNRMPTMVESKAFSNMVNVFMSPPSALSPSSSKPEARSKSRDRMMDTFKIRKSSKMLKRHKETPEFHSSLGVIG